jgi:hypothetical protein
VTLDRSAKLTIEPPVPPLGPRPTVTCDDLIAAAIITEQGDIDNVSAASAGSTIPGFQRADVEALGSRCGSNVDDVAAGRVGLRDKRNDKTLRIVSAAGAETEIIVGARSSDLNRSNGRLDSLR